MTPIQKIKYLIVQKVCAMTDTEPPAYPCEDIDALYDAFDEADEFYDATQEVRTSGIETGVPCKQWSRHFESESVASQMPDGSWVGWTYWYGGGKHAEPAAVEWIEDAYDVQCKEEEKMVVVRTFSTVA